MLSCRIRLGAFVAQPNGATYWTVIIHELEVGRAAVADAQVLSPIVLRKSVMRLSRKSRTAAMYLPEMSCKTLTVYREM